jgi:hypothetical protein
MLGVGAIDGRAIGVVEFESCRGWHANEIARGWGAGGDGVLEVVDLEAANGGGSEVIVGTGPL